jgi:hypothetical protein
MGPTYVVAEMGPTYVVAEMGPTYVVAEMGPTYVAAEMGPTYVRVSLTYVGPVLRTGRNLYVRRAGPSGAAGTTGSATIP